MGVYIPNMKSMFKTCGDCPLDVPNCRLWEELENLNTERHPNCPLIEIDLVRCKDCKHYDTESRTFPCCTDIFGAVRYMEADGFCSKGERRADE